MIEPERHARHRLHHDASATAAYREVLHKVLHRENRRAGGAVHVAAPRSVTTSSAKWHADNWSGAPISRSGGCSTSQTACERGHRGWNAQPPGRNNIEGGAPIIAMSRADRAF